MPSTHSLQQQFAAFSKHMIMWRMDADSVVGANYSPQRKPFTCFSFWSFMCRDKELIYMIAIFSYTVQRL